MSDVFGATTLPSLDGSDRGPLARRLSKALEESGQRLKRRPDLVIERGWPMGKIPLVLRCMDRAADGGCGSWWSVYLLAGERIPFMCRSAVKRRHATYVRPLNAVVQRFPRDLTLTDVEAALGEGSAAETLRRDLAGDREAWRSSSVEVLSYKPSRRLTLRIQCAPEQEQAGAVFVKLLPPGSDDELLAILEGLEAGLRVSGASALAVPELLGRIPSWNALVWREASGASLFDLLATPSAQEAAERAGACLGELHTSAVRWSANHDDRRELWTVESWIRAAGLREPSLQARLSDSFARLSSFDHPGTADRLVPSHRDFYDKQLLLTDDRSTLLDFEFASMAEPELDVGNFIAHLTLRSLQGRLDQATAVAESFLGSYSDTAAVLDRPRLEFYIAASLLRLTCVYSMRDEWYSLNGALLDEFEHTLDGTPRFERKS